MLKKIAIAFGAVTLFIGFNSYFEANKKPNYEVQITKRKVGDITIITLPDDLEIHIGSKIDEESVLPKKIKDFSKIMQSGQYEEYIEQDRYKAVTEKLAALKYNEFNFYGQFLDQNKQPISGAKLELLLLQPIPGGGWYSVPMFTRTNNSGMFHISNVKGEFIKIISVNKTGYTFISRNIKERFGKSLNNVQTSISNPKIFNGWKYDTQAMSNLFSFTAIANNAVSDGQSYTFSLEKESTRKTIIEGQDDDIVISVNKNWNNFDKGIGGEYEILLKVNNGGAIHLTDEYPYQAPESGYFPSITISNNIKSDTWTGNRYTGEFYVKTKNNKYGKIFLDINPFSTADSMRLIVTGRVNTAGERLLLNQIDLKRNKEKNKPRFKRKRIP